MKITSDDETLAENKVLILYTLAKVGKPITNDALYSIVKSAVDLNYFYFQQFLLDLIEVKYVLCTEKETQKYYQITAKGRETLNLTLDILPGIIKLKVDTTFKSDIENIESESSVVAEFTPESENEFEFQCKIVENGEVIFEIKTKAYSREQAEIIVKNWKTNASTLYPKLLQTLTTNKDEK